MALARRRAAGASGNVEIHYAPQEDLEQIDVATIDNAGASIDMAAYVLSDASVIEALRDAADRGVTIRLYLDKGQVLAARPPQWRPDRATSRLSQRFRAHQGARRADGHLKAYAVDGKRLRTGSGNFSRSGLSAQDNDLILVDDREAVARFERNFDEIWSRGTNAGAAGERERGGPR